MEVAHLRGVGPVLAAALAKVGVARVEDLAGLKPADLVALSDGAVDAVRARLVVEAAAEAMGAPAVDAPAAAPRMPVLPDLPPAPPDPPPPEVPDSLALRMLAEGECLGDVRCCPFCAAILVTGNPEIGKPRPDGTMMRDGTEPTYAACTCERVGTVGVNDAWCGRGFKEKVVANPENRRVFQKWVAVTSAPGSPRAA